MNFRSALFFLFLKFFNHFGLAMWHMGLQFPDQGPNLHPLEVEVRSFNRWTTMEVPGMLSLEILHFDELPTKTTLNFPFQSFNSVFTLKPNDFLISSGRERRRARKGWGRKSRWAHPLLMQRTDSLERTLMLGKTEGRRRG